MKKPTQKNRKSTPSLTPEWEDEVLPEAHEDPKIKQEEEAKLFRDAFERGPIALKDNELNEVGRKQKGRAAQKSSLHEIDLHGLTVREAQNHVIRSIDAILDHAKGQTVSIRIITGKGHRSQGREPQLISSIHHVVESTFRHRLISIEVSPHELKLGGSYLKGHFDLKIK